MLMSGDFSDPETISLYVHIPFCSHKCPYCHFYVVPDNESLKNLLLEGLCKECIFWKSDLEGRKVVSIYFGGGTPFLFGPKRVETLLSLIRQLFSVTLDCEITIEANPENITFDEVRLYKELGINRISLGIQSFHNEELALLDRRHPKEHGIDAVYMCHKAGIENISIDLMYEVPKQNLASFQNSLQIASDLPITHLSFYNLTIEPHTPFYRKKAELLSQVANPDECLEMYQTGVLLLQEAGFSHYEISAFCKNDQFSRHNIGYWQAREFLGLGPSGFSFFQGKRFRNMANLKRYSSLLEDDQSPIDFEESISSDARRKELFAIGLRVLKGIERSLFERRFGALESETLNTLQKLQELTLLSCIDGRYQLTKKGCIFYDTVASELI